MEIPEELEQRLIALEEEVGVLREQVASLSPKELSAAAQTPCEVNQASLEEAHQKIIAGNAPGLDNLRALLMAHGVLPGDKIVREIIAGMRE